MNEREQAREEKYAAEGREAERAEVAEDAPRYRYRRVDKLADHEHLDAVNTATDPAEMRATLTDYLAQDVNGRQALISVYRRDHLITRVTIATRPDHDSTWNPPLEAVFVGVHR